MSILIQGGRVITASDDYVADVYVEGETVTAIGTSLDVSADSTIDASGKYVFPGCVDPHTHLDMPFGGTVTIDDVESGQIAAAFGGTTTHVDFVIQGQGQTFGAALDDWRAKAAGKQVIDMGYHMAVTDLKNGGTLEELATLPEQGVTSYKLFMAYKGALMVDDETLFRTMEVAAETGALVMVHAENGDVIDVLVKQALEAGNTDPVYHALTRPPEAEGEATNRAIQLARLAGAPLYVVHVTCKQAVDPIALARDDGWNIWGETCTQYFFKSLDDIAEPNFEGAKYVYSPPVRDKSNWDVLWNAVRTDSLSVISTDHCAFLWDGQKTLGRDDFSKIPNGGPGLEDRLMMIHHFGVNEGRITLNRMVELLVDERGEALRHVSAQGHDRAGLRRRHRDLRSGEAAHDHREDAPLESRLQPLRGNDGHRRAGDRAAARQRARRERRARRLTGDRAVREARPLRRVARVARARRSVARRGRSRSRGRRRRRPARRTPRGRPRPSPPAGFREHGGIVRCGYAAASSCASRSALATRRTSAGSGRPAPVDPERDEHDDGEAGDDRDVEDHVEDDCLGQRHEGSLGSESSVLPGNRRALRGR